VSTGAATAGGATAATVTAAGSSTALGAAAVPPTAPAEQLAVVPRNEVVSCLRSYNQRAIYQALNTLTQWSCDTNAELVFGEVG
jgi:hypothetical protein